MLQDKRRPSSTLAEVWFSDARIAGTYYATLGVPISTIVMCYCLWLSNGCGGLLPFVSDLGLHGAMKIIFTCGLLCTAILMAALMADVMVARCTSECSWCLTILHVVACGLGLLMAFGVGMLGFFPWDTSFRKHMQCVALIFGGGIALAIVNTLRLALLPSTNPNGKSHLGSVWPWRVQLCLLLVSFTAYKMMNRCLIAAWREGFRFIAALRFARTDFHGYCRSKNLDMVSASAACEWLLIASILGIIPTLHRDSELLRNVAGAWRKRSDGNLQPSSERVVQLLE